MTIDDDVETFAVLQAKLQRPFAVRATVLDEVGLREQSLRDAQLRWAARFIAADGAVWRARYRDAFERACAGGLQPSTIRGADVDATLPAVVRSEETLPFAAPTPGVVPPAVIALRGAAQNQPRASSDGEETLWMPPPAEREDER